MADTPGTLERLAAEIGVALAPLELLLTPENLPRLFLELGLDAAPDLAGNAGFGQALSQVLQKLQAMDDAVTALLDAADQDDSTQTLAASAQAIQAIAAFAASLDSVATSIRNAAPELASFAETFVERLLGDSVIRYLELTHPFVLRVLALAGIAELIPLEVTLDGAPVSILRRQLHLDRVSQVVLDPMSAAQTTYGWGTETFDSLTFFLRVRDVFQAVDLLAEVEPADEQGPAALDLFGVAFVPSKTHPPGIEGEEFAELTDAIDLTLAQLSDTVRLALQLSAGAAAGLVVRVLPPVTIEFDTEAAISGAMKLAILGQAATAATPFTVLGETAGSRLEAKQLEAGISADLQFDVAAQKATADVSFGIKITQGKLIVDLSKADGFLTSVSPSNGFQLDFDLALGWSVRRGFFIEGGASLETVLPLHLKAGPLSLELLYLKLALAPEGLQLETSVAASLTLGPIAVTVDRLGMTSHLAFQRGNLGPVDLGVAFKPPNGLGLAIDAGVVAGGGFLSFDPDKGQYAGVLEVELAETIQVKVVGILDTVLPDGTPGYSLLLIVAFDLPPIQLGFGFTLNGVGGLFGANRTMSVDALRGGLRAHTLNSVLFPPDPIANAPQIISNVRSFFPPANGRFVFGPMLELGWGTPTLITMELGVLLELPDPVRLAILGLINVGLPSAEEALIELHIDVLGVIDFAAKKLAIDGSLFDSRVLIYALTGDLVMRLTWGSDPNFLFSLGGFNPHFDTSGMDLPPLKRMAVSIGDGDNPRISSNSYFAVTSNTLQFGANTEAFASAGGFSVHGYLGYDVLVVYSPFSFTFDFKASFDVAVDGLTLTAFDIDGTFSGPRPWHLHAHVSIHLLFFDVGASLTLEWGDSTPVALPQRAVLPDLIPALQDARNWSAQLPDGARQAVSLISPKPQEQTLRVHPMGTLTVRETVAPLDLPITRYAQGEPADGSVFAIKAAQVDRHDDGTQPFQDYFAAAQFLTLSDADKLSKPSFESYDAGLTIGLSGIEAGAAAPRTVQYEERIIDVASGFSRFTRVYAMPGEIHAALTQQGAGAQSAVKNGGLAKFQNGPAAAAITSADPRYVVAGVDDLAIRSDIAPGRGMAYFQAQAALATHLALRPEDEGQLQIVPLHEVAA